MTESEQWAVEFISLLPFIYATKLWNAHCEFMEDLLYVTPR